MPLDELLATLPGEVVETEFEKVASEPLKPADKAKKSEHPPKWTRYGRRRYKVPIACQCYFRKCNC